MVDEMKSYKEEIGGERGGDGGDLCSKRAVDATLTQATFMPPFRSECPSYIAPVQCLGMTGSVLRTHFVYRRVSLITVVQTSKQYPDRLFPLTV